MLLLRLLRLQLRRLLNVLATSTSLPQYILVQSADNTTVVNGLENNELPPLSCASTFATSVTSEQMDLEKKSRILSRKTQLLEACFMKGETEEARERVTEIKSILRSFEGTEYELLPNAETITSALETAEKMTGIIVTALEMSVKKNTDNSLSSRSGVNEGGLMLKPLNYLLLMENLRVGSPFGSSLRLLST